MSAPFQMPYREQAAESLGPRTFRKQILRTGSIPYKGKTLSFDRAYLERAVESFNAKAFDQVPFVLADADNKHSADPERFRGEVKSLEMAGDGIDAIVELTEEGAQVVRENPRLGVSARLVPDVERDGKTFAVAIEHVCGTLNPRVAGMRPWETISLSSVRSASQHEERAQVIDLSASEYMETKTFTSDHLDKLNELPEDQRTRVTALLEGKAEPVAPEKKEEPAVDDKGKKTVADFMRGILGKKGEKLEDKDLEQAFSDLQTPEVKADDKEAVASLSDDDRKRIDLAEEVSRNADRRVAAAEWKSEKRELLDAGVPPAMLDLAEPILKSGEKATIDLSASEKADASEVIRGLLKAAEGTVDLSNAVGSDKDTDERTEAKTLASDEKWEASV